MAFAHYEYQFVVVVGNLCGVVVKLCWYYMSIFEKKKILPFFWVRPDNDVIFLVTWEIQFPQGYWLSTFFLAQRYPSIVVPNKPGLTLLAICLRSNAIFTGLLVVYNGLLGHMIRDTWGTRGDVGVKRERASIKQIRYTPSDYLTLGKNTSYHWIFSMDMDLDLIFRSKCCIFYVAHIR